MSPLAEAKANLKEAKEQRDDAKTQLLEAQTEWENAPAEEKGVLFSDSRDRFSLLEGASPVLAAESQGSRSRC